MSKVIRLLASAAIIAVLLVGCVSNKGNCQQQDSDFGANRVQVQQTSQQSSGFADKQYIWQDWTPSNTQASEKVK